jgi:anti-sigma factor RsiW
MTTLTGHLTDALAQRLVDGALSAAEAPDVERHVAGCAGCQATVETYRLLASALEDLEVPPLPADFTAGVLSRIDAHERALARERRHAVAIFVGACAAVAAAFVAAGAAAWAPAVSSAAETFGAVARALQIASTFVPQVVGALRLQIILATAALALPLLVALARLVPAPAARAETA